MSEWSPGFLVTPVVRLPVSYEGKGPILRGDDDAPADDPASTVDA